MKLTLLPSEKGDCLLLESPDKTAILIDGGMPDSYADYVRDFLGNVRKITLEYGGQLGRHFRFRERAHIAELEICEEQRARHISTRLDAELVDAVVVAPLEADRLIDFSRIDAEIGCGRGRSSAHFPRSLAFLQRDPRHAGQLFGVPRS